MQRKEIKQNLESRALLILYRSIGKLRGLPDPGVPRDRSFRAGRSPTSPVILLVVFYQGQLLLLRLPVIASVLGIARPPTMIEQSSIDGPS